MTKIIAVANQKGGVGKTTTAVNLATSLAVTKRKIMLIDIDPQGNATMGCGVNKTELEKSTFDVLMGDSSIDETLVRIEKPGFDLLPGNDELTAAEVQLLNEIGREVRLRTALDKVKDRYDYILIDCPPSINMLTINALAAATGVIIPMQCEYYALEGLSSLVNTINKIREAINPGVQVEGILRCMFDPRNNLANEVSSQLILHFADKVYRTVIPRNVRLAEAPSYGLPALFYDKNSRGAMAYLALAGEINRRGLEAQAAVG